jgi:hypothetical protein
MEHPLNVAHHFAVTINIRKLIILPQNVLQALRTITIIILRNTINSSQAA